MLSQAKPRPAEQAVSCWSVIQEIGAFFIPKWYQSIACEQDRLGMQQFATTRYRFWARIIRRVEINKAFDRFGARGNCTCSRVNTQSNLCYCAGRLDWTIAAALSNFQIFASAFDLLLQNNNASFEIFNLLFPICKQAPEGQVGALSRVKHLQPCGKLETA